MNENMEKDGHKGSKAEIVEIDNSKTLRLKQSEDEARPAKVKALKRYKITIHSEGDGGDKGDVLLGHNFKLMQIQRDKEVEIDENFLAVLKASVIDTIVKGEDEKMHPVRIPRYNYTVEPI